MSRNGPNLVDLPASQSRETMRSKSAVPFARLFLLQHKFVGPLSTAAEKRTLLNFNRLCSAALWAAPVLDCDCFISILDCRGFLLQYFVWGLLL